MVYDVVLIEENLEEENNRLNEWRLALEGKIFLFIIIS